MRETPPPVAVTLIFTVEAARGEAAVRVMTALPFPGAAMLDCESAAVTPEGSPLTERLRAELNPPPAAVRTVKAALVPGRNVTAGVLEVSVTPGTVTLMVAVRVSPSLVAVMVSV